MDRHLIEKYAAPVPRYTSFPTAPHFNETIGNREYTAWLETLAPSADLSLYLHIPFCDTLCWFCGCTTKIVRRYDPIAAYLKSLLAEIRLVARRAASGGKVTHVHWGGGSPDILAPDDIRRLAQAVRSNFSIDQGAEFAVEIDPRAMTPDKARAFADSGLTRLSVGVQDFDPRVQDSINRWQSYELTRDVVGTFRSHGVASVNIDLIYGLPHQTLERALRTAERVIALSPERIALFGYAHLPQRIRHQRLIPAESLPDIYERFALAQAIADCLVSAGYMRIGLDHFCRPGDTLSTAPLNRNFQGYTTDAAGALIGLGASAISRLPQGYAQNAVPVAHYRRCIESGILATARGIALSEEDRAIGFVIERLMCDLRFPGRELKRRFGGLGERLVSQAKQYAAIDTNHLVEPESDGFLVTEKGRPFLRAICAYFDPYVAASKATHSIAV